MPPFPQSRDTHGKSSKSPQKDKIYGKSNKLRGISPDSEDTYRF